VCRLQTIRRKQLWLNQKFLSATDHSEDVNYKRLLQAWDANPDFDFDFDSRGPDVPIAFPTAAQLLKRQGDADTGSFASRKILEIL
jgi:hypothetical protein